MKRESSPNLNLLQVLILGFLFVFLAGIYVYSNMIQQEVASRTLSSVMNLSTWVVYYPESFFQLLSMFTLTTLVGFLISLASYFKSAYPNWSQLASKKSIITWIFLLNILFLGTSHVLSYPPFPFFEAYNTVVGLMCSYFGLGLQQFYDYSSSVLVAILGLSATLRYHSLGLKGAFVCVTQILSLTFIPLGLEIFTFDHAEWGLHVTQFQAEYNVIPWFTNADLFFVSLFSFCCLTALRWYSAPSNPNGIGHRIMG